MKSNTRQMMKLAQDQFTANAIVDFGQFKSDTITKTLNLGIGRRAAMEKSDEIVRNHLEVLVNTNSLIKNLSKKVN